MKKIFPILLLAASAVAFAAPPGPIGHVYGSPIESISINNEGLVTVFFTSSVFVDFADYYLPRCRHDDMDHALFLDANTDVGKTMLSVLLEAKASGFDVTASGTGRCWPVDGTLVEILDVARVY
jgi:hypothetical protein